MRRVLVLLAAGPLLACTAQQAASPVPPMTTAQYAGLQHAIGDPKVQAAVAAGCADQMKTRPTEELGAIGAALDIDVADTPRVYCERLFAAVARGAISYDDYAAVQAEKHDPEVMRRMLRALRQPADEQRV